MLSAEPLVAADLCGVSSLVISTAVGANYAVALDMLTDEHLWGQVQEYLAKTPQTLVLDMEVSKSYAILPEDQNVVPWIICLWLSNSA